MQISFDRKKDEKVCNSEKAIRKKFGKRQGDLLKRRLTDLSAATVLEDMRNLPGRTKELTANRKGELSVDLVHPDRLIFEPANSPIPRRDDGGLDWTRVTAIRILELDIDYH